MGLFDSIGESLGGEASKASVYLGVETGGVKKGLAEATSQIEGAGSRWGTAFKFASVGLAGFATAFIGFAVDGVKEAAALNAAIARIGAQAGLTTVEMAKMRSGIVDMSTRVPQSVGQITASIEAVTKSGYNWAESLKIQEAAAKVATVTHADLASVTNTVVTAMKGWGIGAADVTKVTDTLLTTVGHSRIGFDDLGRIIATAAPLAKDLGVTFNDLNASIIAVGRSGLAPRRAGSGLIALLRGMASPAAQKEYALLGLTINATTIKQKGLLATLQEIQAAAHKNVNVIVRTKVVHVDLTKATEALRLAELRLSEVRNKNKTSPSQLLAAQDRVTNAQNRLNAAMAKGSGGQIDYAKSAAATAKANKSVSATMQLMTGGAAGQIIADTLLLNKGADQKAGLDALAKSAEATAKEFKAVLAADPGAQMAILVNVIKTFADELGVALLPSLITFIGFLQEAIPNALRGIGMLWDNYLKAPVTAMVGSFLSLVDAFSKAMGFGQGSSGGGGAVLGFFTTLSSIAATVATDLSKVFDLLASILSLPIVKSLMPFVVGGAGITLLLSGAASLVKSLTGKALGLVNTATGGIFKLGKGSSEKLPVDKSAVALNEAAAKLSAAATSLSEAATKGIEASTKGAATQTEATAKASTSVTEAAAKLSDSAIKLGEGATTTRVASTESAAVVGGVGISEIDAIRNQEMQNKANDLSIKASEATNVAADASVQTDKIVVTNAETSTAAVQGMTKTVTAEVSGMASAVVAKTESGMTPAQIMAARVKSGASSALTADEQAMASAQMDGGGVRGAIKGIRGTASSALGAAGGVISNVLSKAIVPLIVAQLVSEIVKAPVGDFISTVPGFQRAGQAIKQDFFGGLIEMFTKSMQGADAAVGHAETMTIGKAKFNTISLAKIGITSATFDKLDAPVGTIEHAQGQDGTLALTTDLGQKTGESVSRWARRIRDRLPDDLKARIDAAFKTTVTGRGTYNTELIDTGLTAALKVYTGQAFTDWTNTTREGYLTALINHLTGFTPGQLSSLSTEQMRTVTSLMQDDTTGQFKFISDALLSDYINGLPSALPSSTTTTITAAQRKASARILARMYGETDRPAPTGEGYHPVSPTDTRSERAGIGRAVADSVPATRLAAEAADLAKARTGVEAAVTAYLATISAGTIQGAKDWASRHSANMDPGLTAELTKRFGSDWMAQLHDGALAISDLPADAALVRAMVAQYGPTWRLQMQQFGTILWQAEGGPDFDTLRKKIGAAIATEVGKLTSADLLPTKDAGKTKSAIVSVLQGMQPSLAALNSPDLLTQKTAVADLSTALAQLMPDGARRAAFITGFIQPLTAFTQAPGLTKTGQGLDNIVTSFSSMPSVLDAVNSRLDAFTARVGGILATPGSSKSSKWNGRGGGAAAGGVFQANSATDLTFGEAGSETAVIVKDPMRTTLAGLMGGLAGRGGAMPGGLSAPGGTGGGSHQNLYVDNMHVTSAPSEWSILQTLAFMSPGGLD